MSVRTSPRPLYLSAADCQRVLLPEDVVRAVEDALGWEAEGGVVWSEPRSLSMSDAGGGRYHLKACVLEAVRVAGVRLVSHQADEDKGSTRWIILLDSPTTLPLAIVDETWSYAQRTVAVMAVAARKLAAGSGEEPPPPSSRGSKAKGSVLALVGAGRLAAAALTYYAHLFELAEVRIASRREETRTALAARARDRLGLKAVPAVSVEEAVRGADQILTCTSSGKGLLSADWVSPGAVVSSLDTPEPGPGFYALADLLVVDSREQLAGELVECYGPDAPSRVSATIGEVLAGRHPGRTSPKERVLIISQGLASLDVALAARAYELARAQGLGAALPMGPNPSPLESP